MKLCWIAEARRQYDPTAERARLEPKLNQDYTPGVKHSSVNGIRYGQPGYRAIDPHALKQAVGYWRKHGKGKRWPALEKALLSRLDLFDRRANGAGKRGGTASDTMRPRWITFQYMGGLRERWPEGERAIKPAIQLVQGHGGSYRSGAPDDIPPGIVAYLDKFPEAMPDHEGGEQDYRPNEMTPEDYYL